MAKFCSFDVRTGIEILLESEAKIEKKNWMVFILRGLTLVRTFFLC